jgi:FkbM family methyltransferase
MRQFLAKPLKGKIETLKFQLRKNFGKRSSIVELPFGAKWRLQDSALDAQVAAGKFENAETAFVTRFLRKGMVILDIGAHHGFYALLASLRVGTTGKVFAFEPSPRERKRLQQHLQLNKCTNVQIVPLAVGSTQGQATLFLVEGAEDYCNSLRLPATESQTTAVVVDVIPLDEFLGNAGVSSVGFIKFDVEGAELDALKGATSTLQTPPKPVLMVEVYDIRTEPWGYRAHEIVRFLHQVGYDWFSIESDGTPTLIEPTLDRYDANLVAVPRENVQAFLESIQVKTRAHVQ